MSSWDEYEDIPYTYTAMYPSMDTLQWDLMRMRYAEGADLEELKLNDMSALGKAYKPKEFKPTPEQVKAFEHLAKLKDKLKTHKPYRQRLSAADSYMLRMADEDLQSDMFGDFNGNESTMDEW